MKLSRQSGTQCFWTYKWFLSFLFFFNFRMKSVIHHLGGRREFHRLRIGISRLYLNSMSICYVNFINGWLQALGDRLGRLKHSTSFFILSAIKNLKRLVKQLYVCTRMIRLYEQILVFLKLLYHYSVGIYISKGG